MNDNNGLTIWSSWQAGSETRGLGIESDFDESGDICITVGIIGGHRPASVATWLDRDGVRDLHTHLERILYPEVAAGDLDDLDDPIGYTPAEPQAAPDGFDESFERVRAYNAVTERMKIAGVTDRATADAEMRYLATGQRDQ